MNSENIYLLSKLKLKGQRFKNPNENHPLKIYYECGNVFRFETDFFMPCHISFIGRYIYGSGLHLKRDSIDEYDILYIYDGKLNINYKNKIFTASKNDVLFIHTDMCYEITINSSESVDVMFLSSNGLISKEYYNLIMKKGFKPIHIKNPGVFDGLFDKILFYMKYPSNSNNALVVDTIIHLFTELYLNSINSDDYDDIFGHPKWFVKTISIINENYNRNITIEELSEISGFSSSHLYKLFREYTGNSPYNYLLNVRIDNAKNLLLNNELSVKYISYSVGFKSVNHFINHFKKITGTTPNSYRKNYTAV